MTDATKGRWAVVLGYAVFALAATILEWPSPARAFLVYPFILVGPGLAIMGSLHTRNSLLVAALIVPVSLSVHTLLATLFVYLEMYSAPLVLVVSIGVSLAALLADRLGPDDALPADRDHRVDVSLETRGEERPRPGFQTKSSPRFGGPSSPGQTGCRGSRRRGRRARGGGRRK